MRNRRDSERRNTPHRTNALSADSGRLIGRVVDITTGGMMILTSQEIPLGETISIRIPLPTMVGGRTDLVLDAKPVWSGKDTHPEFTRVGFAFAPLSSEDAYVIETALHRLHLVG